MNCEQTGQKMQELIDGEIAGPLREEILLHCKECENCRLSYRTFGMLADELKQLSMPKPGSGFKVALISKIAMETAKPVKVSDFLAASALLMAPVLAAFGFQVVAMGNLGPSRLFQIDFISDLVLSIPMMENLKLLLSVADGYGAQHALTVFALCIVTLLFICQVKLQKPTQQILRRQL